MEKLREVEPDMRQSTNDRTEPVIRAEITKQLEQL